jgi:hypothetical protein
MPRRAEELFCARLFDNSAEEHDRHPLRGMTDDRQGMGYQHQRQPQPMLEVRQ